MIRYSYYQKEVLVPFIQRSRTDFDEYVDSTPIPNTLTASSWCDGDIKQIQSIVSDDNILNSIKTIASKHNAARSGGEQPCDRSDTFKLVNKLQSQYTCNDLPADRHPMKRIVAKKFDSLIRDGKLRLVANKKNSLIDFTSSLLEMIIRAATRPNILKGS